jgi:hypothetical protein
MAIPPTDIRIIFTNYDIITYFLNLASCSEHFISIKHRIFTSKILSYHFSPFENENYHRFIISLQANNLTSLSPYATDLTSDR